MSWCQWSRWLVCDLHWNPMKRLVDSDEHTVYMYYLMAYSHCTGMGLGLGAGPGAICCTEMFTYRSQTGRRKSCLMKRICGKSWKRLLAAVLGKKCPFSYDIGNQDWRYGVFIGQLFKLTLTLRCHWPHRTFSSNSVNHHWHQFDWRTSGFVDVLPVWPVSSLRTTSGSRPNNQSWISHGDLDSSSSGVAFQYNYIYQIPCGFFTDIDPLVVDFGSLNTYNPIHVDLPFRWFINTHTRSRPYRKVKDCSHWKKCKGRMLSVPAEFYLENTHTKSILHITDRWNTLTLVLVRVRSYWRKANPKNTTLSHENPAISMAFSHSWGQTTKKKGSGCFTTGIFFGGGGGTRWGSLLKCSSIHDWGCKILEQIIKWA